MHSLSVCTFVLVAISCYAFSSSKSVIQNAHEHEATKNLNLQNRITDRAEPAYLGSSQRNAHAQYHQTIYNAARQKREYKELNDIIDELEEKGAAAQKAAKEQQQQQSQEYDLDNMPVVTYYLLLQKLRQLQSGEPTYRVRTPRLGRSIDFQQLLDTTNSAASGNRHVSFSAAGNMHDGSEDDVEEATFTGYAAGVPRRLVSRIIKKSVPFKPRLGKRAQVCPGTSAGSNNYNYNNNNGD